MHQPFSNTSKPHPHHHNDPSPLRSNRFSHEPTQSHHDLSYSRSRSIEFSPTSLKRSHIPSSSSHQKPALDPRDPRRRLQKADHSRSPPKIQRHHIDYAPRKFSEENDYWKKIELEATVAEIETNQDGDSVSTNSSEKSTGSARQSHSHIELSANKRDPRRDPRLMRKQQTTCQQQTKRKMEAEINAIFGEKEDEEPMIIIPQKKHQEPPMISPNIQKDEDSPLIILKKRDEEPPVISTQMKDVESLIILPKEKDEEPALIPSKENDNEEALTKVPIIISLEEEDDEEETERKDKEFEIPKQPIKIEIEDDDDNEIFEISTPKIRLQGSIGTVDPRKRLQKLPFTNKKLNLVLDLDETLINSHTVTQDFDMKQIKNIPQDSLSIMKNGELKTIIVVRPYYQEFLERMSKHYNLFVYSHGRYDYVQFALEIIDKNKRLISRERIFKNCGQVGRGTSKRLENLGFTQEEINKTIILDDQRQIWEHEHPQVICSKKFIPLKDFIKEEKYSRYLLFKAKQYDKNWLSSHENQSELEFYCETHASYSQQRLCQLELLAHFFEELAKDHEKTAVNSPHIRIHELCETRMKTILKSMKLGIMSNCGARKKMFENVAEILGASVNDAEKAYYLVVDHNVNDDEKRAIKNLVEEKPMIVIVTVGWLMECFFRLSKVSVNHFLRKF